MRFSFCICGLYILYHLNCKKLYTFFFKFILYSFVAYTESMFWLLKTLQFLKYTACLIIMLLDYMFQMKFENSVFLIMYDSFYKIIKTKQDVNAWIHLSFNSIICCTIYWKEFWFHLLKIIQVMMTVSKQIL